MIRAPAPRDRLRTSHQREGDVSADVSAEDRRPRATGDRDPALVRRRCVRAGGGPRIRSGGRHLAGDIRGIRVIVTALHAAGLRRFGYGRFVELLVGLTGCDRVEAVRAITRAEAAGVFHLVASRPG
jgi:hypothetical protein